MSKSQRRTWMFQIRCKTNQDMTSNLEKKFHFLIDIVIHVFSKNATSMV